ncbi:MAG: hypothetical protein IKX48_05375, partial [Victivallales bacterium]|nr:hypothetical protein [Victivallales bacterium]
MKRLLFSVFALLLFASSIHAAVQSGENILVNGDMRGTAFNPMTGEPSKTPDSWIATGAMDGIRFMVEDQKTGGGYVQFSQIDTTKPWPEVV